MVSLAHSFGGGVLKSVYALFQKIFSVYSQIHIFFASQAQNRPFFPACQVSGVITAIVSLTGVPSSSSQRLILMSIEQKHFREAFPTIILLLTLLLNIFRGVS